MQSHAVQKCRTTGSRRGVSFVEFVGFVGALGGGMVLGSIYLGLDVQAMAVGILEKADIEVPEILRESSQTSESESLIATDETTAGNQSDDLDTAPKSETAAGEANVIVTSERPKLTAAEKHAATQSCWRELSSLLKEEAANRSKWMAENQSLQLFDYLLHRQAGHQKVVEAVEQLELQGVDPRLQAHVQQVLAWHRDGAGLFERATYLLTDSPSGNLSGPSAQSWQSAATQHRMEEKLIHKKHSSLAGYLARADKISASADSSK